MIHTQQGHQFTSSVQAFIAVIIKLGMKRQAVVKVINAAVIDIPVIVHAADTIQPACIAHNRKTIGVIARPVRGLDLIQKRHSAAFELLKIGWQDHSDAG